MARLTAASLSLGPNAISRSRSSEGPRVFDTSMKSSASPSPSRRRDPLHHSDSTASRRRFPRTARGQQSRAEYEETYAEVHATWRSSLLEGGSRPTGPSQDRTQYLQESPALCTSLASRPDAPFYKFEHGFLMTRVRGWQVIPASSADAGALSRLESSVWRISHTKYCFWTWVVAIRNQVVYKAVDGTRIVGAAMMSRTASHAGFYLDLVIVDPDYRGHGIGSALVEAALVAAQASEVTALVSTDNKTSLRLLKRCGFATIREEGEVFGGPRRYLKLTRSDVWPNLFTPEQSMGRYEKSGAGRSQLGAVHLASQDEGQETCLPRRSWSFGDGMSILRRDVPRGKDFYPDGMPKRRGPWQRQGQITRNYLEPISPRTSASLGGSTSSNFSSTKRTNAKRAGKVGLFSYSVKRGSASRQSSMASRADSKRVSGTETG